MNPAAALRDRGGAAAVEFVVAMVPLFLLLFCFMQIGKMYTANLVFQHAATVAARAAAVIVEPDLNPGDNGSTDDVKSVARLALGAWQTAIRDVDAKIESAATTGNPNGMITTTLTGHFVCGVALAATLTCGADREVELKATARFPLQGARYRVTSNTKKAVGTLAGSSAKSVCDPSSPYDVCSQ
jgi:Flp pilus assembly protein TadG